MYAGAELVTGDAIADAIMEYSAALADDATAETVDIPVIEKDGSRGVATILVGPASQIVARSIDTDGDELVDPEALERIRQRTFAHRPVVTTGPAVTRAVFDEGGEEGI